MFFWSTGIGRIVHPAVLHKTSGDAVRKPRSMFFREQQGGRGLLQ